MYSCKAYDQDLVRHPDGSKEGWCKIERPKVRRDPHGRATHIHFAAKLLEGAVKGGLIHGWARTPGQP